MRAGVQHRSTSFRFPFDLILCSPYLLLICQFTKDLDTFGASVCDFVFLFLVAFGQNLQNLFKPKTSRARFILKASFISYSKWTKQLQQDRQKRMNRLPFRGSLLLKGRLVQSLIVIN